MNSCFKHGFFNRWKCSRQIAEVLESVVSTSKWPRNEAKFLASSRPRPRKTGIKSLVLKMAEKKAEIPRNSLPWPRKAEEKWKIPRFVLSSTSYSPDDPLRTSVPFWFLSQPKCTNVLLPKTKCTNWKGINYGHTKSSSKIVIKTNTCPLSGHASLKE